MKQLFLIFCVYLSGTCIAQDYFSGKLFDVQGTRKDVLYDRTQNDISATIFQTVYKVTDLAKKPLYTFTLTHDRRKCIILVSTKKASGQPIGCAISYNKDECALIISNEGSLDTVFDINYNYQYLISFTDTDRTYPIVHKLKTADNCIVVLDPLSKIRIRKHNDLVNHFFFVEAYSPLNKMLTAIRDSLFTQKSYYQDAIDTKLKEIDRDVTLYVKDRKVEQDKKRYEGTKRFGNPHGKGMLVVNGSIYDGDFTDGNFVAGNVSIKYNDYEYCGEFKNDTFNGIGWLKYNNGSYLLGVFTNGAFSKGLALQKEKNGEIYFGGFNGKRSGFGEFQNTAGGKYSGLFNSGRLSKGYAKEVDPFGYYSYSLFENGIKTPVEAKAAEEFFGISLSEDK